MEVVGFHICAYTEANHFHICAYMEGGFHIWCIHESGGHAYILFASLYASASEKGDSIGNTVWIMGNYVSCTSSKVPSNVVRVIALYGRVQQFESPIKAADLMLDNP
jgi:hypothetical protein